MIEDCQRLAGLREQNFTGNWFARQFITLLNIGGKGTPQIHKNQTPMNNNDSTVHSNI